MASIARKENWPSLLVEAIKAKENKRGIFGVHDCCISVCDLVESMTGVDIGKRFRGYRGRAEMRETLDVNDGVEAIAESVMSEYGCEEINPRMAQRGDVVLLTTEQGDAMGAIDMDGRHAITSGARGWVTLPIDSIRRAWRVG